ncbi:MAG: hypothetical protein KME26_30650 [Oscillatoria princeps RMCB-10]|nr:hypothetical protein [Oscillatoria princeps RMCB-10]
MIIGALSLTGQTSGLLFSEKGRFACGIAKSWETATEGISLGIPGLFEPGQRGVAPFLTNTYFMISIGGTGTP